MKKILLLLLLATFSIQAQTLQNPTYGNVKLKNNTTDNSATKVNVQSTDGTINTISKSDLVNVVEVNDVPSLPLVGEVGKIYVVKNVNKIYRWNGTFYQKLEGTDISGKEDIANKQNSLAVDGTGVKFPTVDATNAGLGLKAPLASPSLTGTPTAPTATAGTNTTQIATTAFVTNGIATADSQNVKLSGNQSITGTKTFNSGVVVNNSGIGNAIDVINTGSGNGLFGNNTNTGSWGSINSATGSTGDLLRFTKNNVLTSSISAIGEFMSPSIGIGTSPPTTTKLSVLQSNNLTAVTIRNGVTSSHNSLYMGNDSSMNASFLGSYKADDSNFSTLILQKFGGNTILGNSTDNGVDKLQVNGSATFSSTVTASPATLDTQLATLGQVKGTRPYKVYTALLSQSGTNAPTAVVLENTLGGTVVWTRNSTGLYTGTLAGVFTVDKTLTLMNTGYTVNGFEGINRVNVNSVQIQTYLNGPTYSDGRLANSGASIEIRVYN